MNRLIKNIFLAMLVIAQVYTCSSQTYINTPGDTLSLSGMMEDLHEPMIRQENISTDTIQLQWKKVSASVPANWDVATCDNYLCYTSLEDSGAMNPVSPGAFGFLIMKITPHVNYGTAVIRYAVWDAASPSVKDTLTFILAVNDPQAINEIQNQSSFSIFPNPASDFINIRSKNNFKFYITDISGKEILNTVKETNHISVSTSELSAGVYLVKAISNNFSATQKLILR